MCVCACVYVCVCVYLDSCWFSSTFDAYALERVSFLAQRMKPVPFDGASGKSYMNSHDEKIISHSKRMKQRKRTPWQDKTHTHI